MATIVLAHGAWSAAWAWKKMRPLFAAAGHQFFSPTYTGLGERAHLAHHEIDLTTHINEEERLLLPYIVKLNNANLGPYHFSEYIMAGQRYSIAAFLKDHHDTEDELKDIREAIRLYQPPATNESLFRILLTQLETFEQDLHVHALIEEEVLIPKALKLESEVRSRMDAAGKLN